MKQNGSQPKTFGELSFFGKVAFLGKVVIFLASFGFVYPTLFAE